MEAVTTFKDPPSLPPAEFDPVHNPADLDRLDEFWLPSRPDPDAQPELYAHWKEMFWPVPTFVWAGSQSTASMLPLKPTSRRVKALLRSNKFQHSPNWSGVYLESKNGNRFARVSGAWTVPQLRPGVRRTGDPHLPFQCSIWIGIDGKKRWTNSMPQVGTAQVLKDGHPQEQMLWWQWWRRGYKKADGLPFDITNVPVRVGDRVLCSISAHDLSRVRLHVVNRTRGAFATIELEGAVPFKGTTAEWIVERPADFTQPGPETEPGPLFPLPDYGKVLFDKCAAQYFTAPAVTPKVARLVTMTQVFHEARRVAVISSPSPCRLPGTVEVTYRRPRL